MPIMPDAALLAVRAHDQAHQRAGGSRLGRIPNQIGIIVNGLRIVAELSRVPQTIGDACKPSKLLT
jgi:hypothetical protein